MGVRLTHYVFDEACIGVELGIAGTTSVYRIRDALAALAARGGHTCRLLSRGHRRWWIGSLVQALRDHGRLLAGCDLGAVERALASLLRGQDCGVAMPQAFDPAPFPVVPDDDVDLRMSVLSAAALGELHDTLARVLALPHVGFAPPPGPVGIAPGYGEEWDAWVREAAGVFAGELAGGHGLASFIG